MKLTYETVEFSEGYVTSIFDGDRLVCDIEGHDAERRAKEIVTAVECHEGAVCLIKALLDVWDPEWRPGKSLHASAVEWLESAEAGR